MATKRDARGPPLVDAVSRLARRHPDPPNLAPGTKLPEDERWAISSFVSRTIVRSALQALAHDRLVTLEPNRGAFVAKPTKLEAREVFEARALIEPKVAALAAEVAKSAEIWRCFTAISREEHAAVTCWQGRRGRVAVGTASTSPSPRLRPQSILTDICARALLAFLGRPTPRTGKPARHHLREPRPPRAGRRHRQEQPPQDAAELANSTLSICCRGSICQIAPLSRVGSPRFSSPPTTTLNSDSSHAPSQPSAHSSRAKYRCLIEVRESSG